MANMFGILQSTINSAKKNWKAITVTILNEGQADERRALDVVQHNKTLIASIDQSDITDNVYTVPENGKASRMDGLINDGVDDLTVTIEDVSKTLKPGDIWSQDLSPFTEITFSLDAMFRVDIMR